VITYKVINIPLLVATVVAVTIASVEETVGLGALQAVEAF